MWWELTRSIIDRAGILPLSIAGVFKEVSTISISAWVFGDQLTRLNVVGVVIAVCGMSNLCSPAGACSGCLRRRARPRATWSCKGNTDPKGIALYSFHKYQKSISDPDEHGHGHGHGASRALSREASHPQTPTSLSAAGAYALASSEADERGVAPAPPRHKYPPGGNGFEPESPEERVERLRDEFEGFNEPRDGEGDGLVTDSESEVGEDEVVKRREERIHSEFGLGLGERKKGRWGEWWDREMW